MKRKQIYPIMLCVVTAFLLSGCVSFIQYDEFGVEKTFTGKLQEGLMQEGLHWTGFSSVKRVNSQVRNYEVLVEGASNDYQTVRLSLNLNIRPREEKVYDFVKNYRSEEEYKQFIDNKVQERVKTVLLRYSAEDVLVKRLEISEELIGEVKDIAELDYFTFNDLAIKNVEFSEEFNAVLEKKAQVLIERDIIVRQKQNLELLKKNTEAIDIDTYFKYQLIEKWDGKSDLVIADSLLKSK